MNKKVIVGIAVFFLTSIGMFTFAQINNRDEGEPNTVNGDTDTTAPVIELIGDNPLYVEAGNEFNDPGADATDNEVLTNDIVVTGTVNTSVVGTYTLNYDVEDDAGNKADTVTRQVIVRDTRFPEIIVGNHEREVVVLSGDYIYPVVTATDPFYGDIEVTRIGEVNTTIVGRNVITYRATDINGNTSNQNIVVEVYDPEAPVITINGDEVVTIDVDKNNPNLYQEDGATAIDNYDDTVNVIIGGDTVDTSLIGVYEVTYDATDSEGNIAVTKVRTIHVVDKEAPVISLVGDGDVTLEVLHSTYTELEAIVTDNYYDGLVVTVGGDTVDTNIVNDYIVTYNVTDPSGNPALEVTRTIHVVDTKRPTVTLTNPTNMKLEVGDTYIEPGYSAWDEYDKDLTSNIVPIYRKRINNKWKKATEINTSEPGEYKIKYKAIDSSGNKKSKTRYITVVTAEPTNFTFNPVRHETIEGSKTNKYDINSTTVTAYDEFDDTYYSTNTPGNIRYVRNYVNGYDETNLTSVDLTRIGKYRLDYYITDTTGHTNYAYKFIYVEDNTRPSMSINSTLPRRFEEGMNEPDWNTYINATYDNINQPLDLTYIENVDMNIPGNYKVTFTVTETENTNWDGNPRQPLSDEFSIDIEVVEATPEKISFTTGWNPKFEADRSKSVLPDKDNIGFSYDQWDNTNLPVQFLGCETYVYDDEQEKRVAGSPVTEQHMMRNPGVYWCSYKATDSTNHTRWNGRKVIIEDSRIPALNLYEGSTHVLNPVINIEANGIFDENLHTYRAYDYCDGDLFNQVIKKYYLYNESTDSWTEVSNITTNTLNTFKITYNVSDLVGNPAIERVRIVNIVDTGNPEINLYEGSTLVINPVVNLEVYTPFDETYHTYSAQDAYEGNMFDRVTKTYYLFDLDTNSWNIAPSINTNALGNYKITYNVMDPSGNIAEEKIRLVNIVDTTDPSIELRSGYFNINIGYGKEHLTRKYRTSDNYDTDVDVNFEIKYEEGIEHEWGLVYVGPRPWNWELQIIKSYRVIYATGVVYTAIDDSGNESAPIEYNFLIKERVFKEEITE